MLGGFHDFAVVVTVGALLAVCRCGDARSHGALNSKAKVQQVKVGMTVKQVDEILGKPVPNPSLPTEIREYQGYADQWGNHDVTVMFKDGVVVRVIDIVPKKSRW